MTKQDLEKLKSIYDTLTDGQELIASFDYMQEFKRIIDSEFKLLDLHSVSNRRELLCAFSNTFETTEKPI